MTAAEYVSTGDTVYFDRCLVMISSQRVDINQQLTLPTGDICTLLYLAVSSKNYVGTLELMKLGANSSVFVRFQSDV